MKIKTIKQREGELLGPVDWNYDFDQHKWSDNRGGVNPEIVDEGKVALKILETKIAEGKPCTVGCYGTRQKVLHVGMYDGWPFWKPTPSVGLESWLGVEWQPFYNIRNVEEMRGKNEIKRGDWNY